MKFLEELRGDQWLLEGERGQVERCLDIQGNLDDISGEGRCLYVFYDVNFVYGILVRFFKMELWEVGREIRELEKGYIFVLIQVTFVVLCVLQNFKM